MQIVPIFIYRCQLNIYKTFFMAHDAFKSIHIFINKRQVIFCWKRLKIFHAGSSISSEKVFRRTGLIIGSFAQVRFFLGGGGADSFQNTFFHTASITDSLQVKGQSEIKNNNFTTYANDWSNGVTFLLQVSPVQNLSQIYLFFYV